MSTNTHCRHAIYIVASIAHSVVVLSVNTYVSVLGEQIPQSSYRYHRLTTNQEQVAADCQVSLQVWCVYRYLLTPNAIQESRRSPRKTEKNPVYVLNITVPPQHVDNCVEPSKAVVQLQVCHIYSTLLPQDDILTFAFAYRIQHLSLHSCPLSWRTF